MLDHTTIVWTMNWENSHSHKDIPWAFIVAGLVFRIGQMVDAGGIPHNRLLLSIAHGMGLTDLSQFGNLASVKMDRSRDCPSHSCDIKYALSLKTMF